MRQESFFNLNSWGLVDSPARVYAQAAFDHDLTELRNLTRPASWPRLLVDPIHLFACGRTRSGGLHASRQALACLIEQGGDINALDASGWVPMSYSAWFGLASTMDLLLEAGAEVHPDNAPPPLLQALSSLAQTNKPGAHTCARLLLMSGADPLRCSINDIRGRSSFLSWALSVGNMEIANLLWAKGDRIRSDKELAMLVWGAELESLDWLVEHDYDVLPYLPSDSPHREDLFILKSARQRARLTDVARAARPFDDLNEEGGVDDQGSTASQM